MATSKSLMVSPLFTRILSMFPQDFSFCFAYGSGVKKQLISKPLGSASNMIDLIYCVDNSNKWHEDNLKLNNLHYSGLKYLGPLGVTKFQENYGAKVYYNTLIPFEDILIKYGVISTKDLITDLLEWSHLYVAGRLHKPVEIVIKPSSSELQTALQLNLQSAVHTALLVLPESFTEYEFYYAVSRLSYSGDFRMYFGENKNKIENIVKPQLAGFRNLYKSLVDNLKDYLDIPIASEQASQGDSLSKQVICSQDVCPLAKLHHLNQLPRWPQKALTRFWNRGKLRQDTEDVLRAIAYDPECNIIVEQCINGIVWQSSIRQSLKGILTAGVLKSVQYSSKKIVKMLR